MLQRAQVHHYLYVVLAACLCVSIPLSNAGMSITMLLLVLNWLVEGQWAEKWKRLKLNKSALVSGAFVLVCCLGFIHATDFSKSLKDFAHYLPLFITPLLVVSSKPMTIKESNYVLGAFVGSVVVSTLISGVYYISHEIKDIREISIFISHIRLSLCIDVALVLNTCILLKDSKLCRCAKIGFGIALLWLVFYMFVAQTLTGIILLCVVIFVFCIYNLLRKDVRGMIRYAALACLALLAAVFVYAGVITYQYFHAEDVNVDSLEMTTINGNPYHHDLGSMVENGSRVGVYVCEEELEGAWKQRSEADFDSGCVEATLIRYLNSCHLRKDSAGVMALSEQDVRNVECGIANVSYTQSLGLKRALYPVFFSFQLYAVSGVVNESSLLQRVACWKAAWKQIDQHPWLGVGLANHKVAIDAQLSADNSEMQCKKEMGAHNQFLTFWLQGGVFVLLYFLVTLFYPFVEKGRKISFVYVAFFIILFCSMFTEDTLQTEAGIVLFAVMNSLLLYRRG